jgi:signal peptidase I
VATFPAHRGVNSPLGVVAAAVVALALGGCGSEGDTKTYVMPSESMEPTLSAEDEVEVDISAYDASEPEAGDLVVFHPPAGVDSGVECGERHPVGRACGKPTKAVSSQTFLKRVVAGPGDELAIEKGYAVIDGERQEEPFAAGCGSGACDLPKPVTIPPGHYFMLGDNRGASADSRFWGPVPAGWILGRVELDE